MTVYFEGHAFELLPFESVLEGIERHGASLPSFCRRGVCQVCLVKATRGTVPALAQKGLKDGLRRQSLFLACVCHPTEDLEVARVAHAERYETHVTHVEELSGGVLRVLVAAPSGLRFQAGQYVHLERPSDGLMRPYSIASLPGSPHLELHVALLRDGAMSGWLRGATGQPVALRGPFGECFYLPEEPDRPLCLAGTGTGLAPLLGVLRAALAAGHRGPIRLFHGSTRRAGLYLWAELEALLATSPGLELVGSVLDAAAPGEAGLTTVERGVIHVAALDDVLLAERQAWADQRVYLCGHPDVVRKLQKKLYLAGVPLARIHSDPFVAPPARV